MGVGEAGRGKRRRRKYRDSGRGEKREMCLLRQSGSEWGTIIWFDLYTLGDQAGTHTHTHALSTFQNLLIHIHPNTFHIRPPPHAHSNTPPPPTPPHPASQPNCSFPFLSTPPTLQAGVENAGFATPPNAHSITPAAR